MIRMIRERLSLKISLRLVLLALPLLSVAVWWTAEGVRANVREMLIDKGRVAALAGARAFGAILESGIDAGKITLHDVVEPTYTEIPYPFKIEHRRYHTQYDWYTDANGVQAVEDAILASSPEFIYSSAIDVRGYVPTPHGRYAEAPTGDVKHDRDRARAKQKYDQPLHLAAAGYLGEEPTLVQDYLRDTGDRVWDVAAPIRVKGQHYGAFRVGVLQDSVDAYAVALALALARVLGLALVLLAGVVFWATQRATHHLRELACAATRLSTTHDGSELRTPIRAHTIDEVGQMARALDRLRVSLLAVWDKIA